MFVFFFAEIDKTWIPDFLSITYALNPMTEFYASEYRT